MKVQIEITDETISKSIHMTCCRCPVALSINREEPGLRIKNASVGMLDGHCTVEEIETEKIDGQTKIKGVERWVYKYALPPEAIEFVARWDARKDVNPLSFELDLRRDHVKSGGGTI